MVSVGTRLSWRSDRMRLAELSRREVCVVTSVLLSWHCRNSTVLSVTHYKLSPPLPKTISLATRNHDETRKRRFRCAREKRSTWISQPWSEYTPHHLFPILIKSFLFILLVPIPLFCGYVSIPTCHCCEQLKSPSRITNGSTNFAMKET